MSAKITIVACADRIPTEPYLRRGFDAFIASSERYGFKPLLLGMGEPWGGLGSKPRLLMKALNENRVKTPYMLFADAYDVAFAADPEYILVKWAERFSRPLVWNAEKTCFPEASLVDAFHNRAISEQRRDAPYPFLNSGLAIGYTEYFFSSLKSMDAMSIPDDHVGGEGKRVEPNDQLFWQREFLKTDKVFMGLDYEGYLFQTMHRVEACDFDLRGPYVINNETRNIPLAFHFNGPSKTAGMMEPILQKLGL